MIKKIKVIDPESIKYENRFTRFISRYGKNLLLILPFIPRFVHSKENQSMVG